MTKNLRKQIVVLSKSETSLTKIETIKACVTISVSAIVFIKGLMKNKYLIKKHSEKNVKPFFSNKGVNSLVEKYSIVIDESKIANIMNNGFSNVTKTFNLETLDKS